MQIMHYLRVILISLSTRDKSSILRVVLLSYKQTDTTKGFKEDKEEHEDYEDDDDDEERRNSCYSFE